MYESVSRSLTLSRSVISTPESFWFISAHAESCPHDVCSCVLLPMLLLLIWAFDIKPGRSRLKSASDSHKGRIKVKFMTAHPKEKRSDLWRIERYSAKLLRTNRKRSKVKFTNYKPVNLVTLLLCSHLTSPLQATFRRGNSGCMKKLPFIDGWWWWRSCKHLLSLFPKQRSRAAFKRARAFCRESVKNERLYHPQ